MKFTIIENGIILNMIHEIKKYVVLRSRSMRDPAYVK